jgi:hypothetical protein
MTEENLETQLENIRQRVTQDEFIEILLGYLEQSLSEDARDIYQVWLQAYGYKDKRVINYWRKILTASDPWQQERAVHNLFAFCESGNTVACEALREFLGEIPSQEELKMRVFRKLGLE